MKFIDSTGLGILWNKIKSSFLSLEGGGTIKFSDIDASIALTKRNNKPNIRLNIPYDENDCDVFSVDFINDNVVLNVGIEEGGLNCIRLDSSKTTQDCIKINTEPYATNIPDNELNEILI